jgi:ADP-ribose pyrophosphatase
VTVLATAAPYADLIPTSAAGRDPIFFFGTLMHDDVLEAVLDRSVAAHETTAALLRGYRRERAAAASYPVLVEDPGAAVEGRLLHRPTRRCILRVNHFEDDEYRACRLTVLAAGQPLAAWVFLPLDHVAMMQPSGEPWHLDRWAGQHLDAYREAIDGWMADAPL